MHVINENESFPEEISKEEDFELPHYVLNIPTISGELIDSSINILAATNKGSRSNASRRSGAVKKPLSLFSAPQPQSTRASGKRRATRGTPDTHSRSSTPSSVKRDR